MAEKKTVERVEELRAMNEDALNAAVAANHKAIYMVRKDRLSKPVSDVKATKAAKKDIARILTIKRQRALGITK